VAERNWSNSSHDSLSPVPAKNHQRWRRAAAEPADRAAIRVVRARAHWIDRHELKILPEKQTKALSSKQFRC
jgi:hypothetical protein